MLAFAYLLSLFLLSPRMYLDPTFSVQDQWMVTKMIYGAQSDAFDFHMVRQFIFSFLHNITEQSFFFINVGKFTHTLSLLFCTLVGGVQLQHYGSFFEICGVLPDRAGADVQCIFYLRHVRIGLQRPLCEPECGGQSMRRQYAGWQDRGR